MNHRRTILVATLSTSLLLVAACGDDGPPSGSTVAESTVAESSVPESSGPDSTGPESTGP